VYPGPDERITALLAAHNAGDAEALRRLVPLVYDRLHRMAHRKLGAGRPGRTLDTTSLVHEAYVRLVDRDRAGFQDSGHFFAVAATAMRQVIVDYARERGALKRGGDRHRVPLDGLEIEVQEQAEGLLALDAALSRLSDLHPRWTRVVECRFFAGLSAEETALALDVSARTVQRDWLKARAWLNRELEPAPPG
jgi:RNA polymerase sigma factor (TIGR02999 family)